MCNEATRNEAYNEAAATVIADVENKTADGTKYAVGAIKQRLVHWLLPGD